MKISLIMIIFHYEKNGYIYTYLFIHIYIYIISEESLKIDKKKHAKYIKGSKFNILEFN